MIYDSKKKFKNTLYLCTNIHQDVMNFLGDRMLRNIKKWIYQEQEMTFPHTTFLKTYLFLVRVTYNENDKPTFSKISLKTCQYLMLTIFPCFLHFKRKLLTKVKKPSMVVKEKKSLISGFACFLTAILKV